MIDTLLFWLSKIVWTVIAPGSLLLILVLFGWLLLMRGATRKAKWVLGFAAFAMLLIALVPLGDWLLEPLETRFPANPKMPTRIDGIIVLGGVEDGVRTAAWNQVEVNEAAERFLASLALARRYPSARVLFTSGSGSLTNQKIKGADVAKRLYLEQGLDPSRLILESNARNTVENAVLSRALAKPARGEVWVLVTSASHMPRAVGVFCKAGWPVLPYPVDHHTVRGQSRWIDYGLTGNLDALNMAIKEWLGLASYYLMGRTSALFPEGC